VSNRQRKIALSRGSSDLKVLVRAATAADVGRISRLLRSWSHTYTLSPAGEGAEVFLATLTEPAAQRVEKHGGAYVPMRFGLPD
jgi:hypothetical protein